MKTFSIKEAVGRGWTLFKANKKILVLGSLILMLISNLQNADVLLPAFPKVALGVLGLIFFVISMAVQIGWYKLLFKVYDGVAANLKELFRHWDLFFKYLGAMVVFMVLISIPLLAAVTVGLALPLYPWVLITLVFLGALVSIYLAVRYNFAFLLVIDSERTIVESFKVSASMTQAVKLKLVGLLIILALINLLGMVALLIGLLVSMPVTVLAYLHVYRTLLRQVEEKKTAPSLDVAM